jgi:hypothetical protein
VLQQRLQQLQQRQLRLIAQAMRRRLRPSGQSPLLAVAGAIAGGSTQL